MNIALFFALDICKSSYLPFFVQELIDAGVDTMAKCFKFGLDKHRDKKCIATRKLLSEEDEVQPNGKVFKKWKMGEYTWNTFTEVDTLSSEFGRGLRELGQMYKQNICIFADTRAEWMVAAQACFKQTFPVVTLYTNLGEEAIAHAINLTEVEIVLTTHELMPKFKTILSKTKKVNCIIYMEDQVNETDVTGYKKGVQIISYKEVIAKGKHSQLHPTLPEPSDPAIIMFTSGSTGNPKGVIVTHENMMEAIQNQEIYAYDMFGEIITTQECYLAYLPLAHILELNMDFIW